MKIDPRYRFPGMDPWLENPAWWVAFHHDLITAISWDLCTKISPRYTAKYGTRLVVESPEERWIHPDVVIARKRAGPIRGLGGEEIDPATTLTVEDEGREEAWVEVRTTGPMGRVVTVIEVLSPGNKRRGSDAAEKYREKQLEVLQSDVHLVEIDLLRGGEHVVALPEDRLEEIGPYDQLVVIRRANVRSTVEFYARRMRDRLPRIGVPLLAPDPDASLDLQALVEGVHRAGDYWNLIDYSKPPTPPLSRGDAAWARTLVRRKK